MQGDASRDELMEAAHIERAARLIVSAGRDDTSILIVLTARKLAPGVPIAVAIREQDNEDIAATAGATSVINPVAVTGRMLAAAGAVVSA
jgi:voltage-gated potassium channel